MRTRTLKEEVLTGLDQEKKKDREVHGKKERAREKKNKEDRGKITKVRYCHKNWVSRNPR